MPDLDYAHLYILANVKAIWYDSPIEMGIKMAIYSFNRKIQNRTDKKDGSVRNAVFAAAYYRGEKRTCYRINETKDFSQKRQEVIYTDCVLPADAPAWALKLRESHIQDGQGETTADLTGRNFSETAWNLIENMEKRYDAQLYIRDIIALPIELNPKQAIALAKEFVKNEIALEGTFCDMAIHWDLINPHLHLMQPAFRTMTDEGFSKKVRMTPKQLEAKVVHYRERWASYANRHLKAAGHDVIIDHRSNQDRGIDLQPTVKVGKATHMHQTGHQEYRIAQNQRIRAENFHAIEQNPERLTHKLATEHHIVSSSDVKDALARCAVEAEVLKTITDQNDFSAEKQVAEIVDYLRDKHVIFSERDLKSHILSQVESNTQFQNVANKVMRHDELLSLGLGDDGREHFVTKAAFALSSNIHQQVETLANRRHFAIEKRTVKRIAKQFSLNDSQRRALKKLTESVDIGLIRGYAGTGKTYLLKAAKAVWEAEGYRVHGVAFMGKSAGGLQDDAGIRSSTIENFMRRVEGGSLKLGKRDILVMDEAGATSLDDMHRILKTVVDHEMKFCAVGDPEQTESIGRGAVYRAMLAQLGHVNMTDIIRQKVAWQRNAAIDFEGDSPEKGLRAYHEKGQIQFAKSPQAAKESLVDAWFTQLQTHAQPAIHQQILMAFKNETVLDLNKIARERLVAAGILDAGSTYHTARGSRQLSLGERIVFNQNNRTLGVKNGHFATITAMEGHEITAKLDNDTLIHFSADTYRAFDYGYAATVHRLQGYTSDYAFTYMDSPGWNKNLLTVGSTRHRHDVTFIADHENFADYAALEEIVCRSAPKDHVLDYPVSFALHRGMNDTKPWPKSGGIYSWLS